MYAKAEHRLFKRRQVKDDAVVMTALSSQQSAVFPHHILVLPQLAGNLGGSDTKKGQEPDTRLSQQWQTKKGD